MDVKFSGFGGQGIIKSGILIGKAAALYDQKHATLTQSFGPEARGGACSAQLVIDTKPILYPYIIAPQILVTMSQEAYEKFIDELCPGGILITDRDLVQPHRRRSDVELVSIPATRMAEELGNRILANVVMMGFFTALTGIVSPQSVKAALPGTVPPHFVKINLQAFDQGYDFGIKLQKQAEKLIPVES